MQQIADWLEKLGLGQYAQGFAENEIDISVLRHLSDQDLFRSGIGEKYLPPLANLPALPRRHVNLPQEWSQRPRNLPNAAKSR
jgi:SAM domain (Sterile alpha motif)